MRKFVLCCALVVFFLAYLYSPVLNFSYVWDDVALFLDSAALRGGALGWWGAITQPILPGTTYLRPLVLASIYSEFKINGPSAMLSHSINLVIFLINCILVGQLARVLAVGQLRSRQYIVALAAMLFYGVHPAQIESVAWVAGRFDLMVTMFTLLALLLSVRTGNAYTLLMALCFFAATLSKEMAVTLPVLLVLFYMSSGRDGFGVQRFFNAVVDLRGRLFVLLCVGFLYLALRSHVMSSLFHQDQVVNSALTPLTHVSLVGHTLFFYFKTIFFPFTNIGPLHLVDASLFSAFEVCEGLGFVLVCVLFCVWTVVKGGVKSILILAAIVALLPVLNIVPLTIGGNVGHERFLALPLAFVAMAFAILFAQLPRYSISAGFRRTIFGLIVIWLAVATYVVSVQLPFWQSGLSLWSWAYAKNPNSEFARFSLIAENLRLGDVKSAGAIFDEIEAREGSSSRRLSILKAAYLQRTGHYAEALALMDVALDGVSEPHSAVIASGINLVDAHISRETFSEGWTYRFVYGVRAEAYLGLKRYKDVLESVRIGKFYQDDYAPLYLLEAMALYGLDRVSDGDDSWGHALSLYIDQGQIDAKLIMKSFKEQVCKGDDKPQHYCERYEKYSD